MNDKEMALIGKYPTITAAIITITVIIVLHFIFILGGIQIDAQRFMMEGELVMEYAFSFGRLVMVTGILLIVFVGSLFGIERFSPTSVGLLDKLRAKYSGR